MEWEPGFDTSGMDNHEVDESDTWIFYKVYLGIILAISIGTMIWVIFRTFTFVQVFGTNKKLVLTFLLLVWASTVGRVLYFIFEYIWRMGEWSLSTNEWAESLMHWLSSTLFAGAVVVNTFNWIYQTIKMKKFRHYKYRSPLVVHLFFAIFGISVFLTYVGFALSSWLLEHVHDTIFNIFTLIYSASFFIIGVTYLAVGINFYLKFKVFNRTEAEKIKIRVVLSISIISFSFIARGVLNVLYFVLDKQSHLRRQWLKANNIWFPLIMSAYFIISEILPTIYLWIGLRMATNDEIERNKTIEEEIDEGSRGFGTINFDEPLHSELSIGTDESYKSGHTKKGH